MLNSTDVVSAATTFRVAIVSDLHYRCRADGPALPATSNGDRQYDPVQALIDCASGEYGWKADVLLCPGDIPDRSDAKAFDEGWRKLKELQSALSAEHLIAATGNHEVVSRAEDKLHDHAGNVEISLDPLGYLQRYPDYPSSIWNGADRRWVYWGRGYEFIESGEMLLLLVNSSHFHQTTRPNEFERGRMSDVALEDLRAAIRQKVEATSARAFIALMHHHPVNHEDLDVNLGRIDMVNGSRLIQVLAESGAGWLVVHGHKHHGRLILSQGDGGQPVVLAAGSTGAHLGGVHGIKTRLQAYLIGLDLPEAKAAPSIRGTVSALSWVDGDWVPATDLKHGIPDGCGFAMPMSDISEVAAEIGKALTAFAGVYCSWDEVKTLVPRAKYLYPGQLKHLRNELMRLGTKAIWPENRYFPEQLAP